MLTVHVSGGFYTVAAPQHQSVINRADINMLVDSL
nr:MAG TPA: hypothetical protein [Caudoviricetes sp.]